MFSYYRLQEEYKMTFFFRTLIRETEPTNENIFYNFIKLYNFGKV